jgi:hypothetical protein
MSNYKEELENLKAAVAELEAKIAEEQKPKKWELSAMGYYLNGDFSVDRGPDVSVRYIASGMTRESREKAEQLSKELRVIARAIAYRDEFAPDMPKIELGGEIYHKYKDYKSVHYDGHNNEWRAYGYVYPIIGAVYFPSDVAKELCRKLNSGEVEF